MEEALLVVGEGVSKRHRSNRSSSNSSNSSNSTTALATVTARGGYTD
jgi:hypothetical protein